MGTASTELAVGSRVTSDGSVTVCVADTGPGIAAGTLDQVFDPFFSTKAGGMGMGLSISRTIVTSHGGKLSCLPNGKRGVLFQLELPVPEAP